MSTANFGKAAKKFTDAGIIGKWLIPIVPRGAIVGKGTTIKADVMGKAPGRFNPRQGAWSGLHGPSIVSGFSRDDFESFQDWPTPNVGILGRAFPAIDNDAGSEKARIFVEKVLAKSFGEKAVYGKRIRGKGPRRLYAFKAYDVNDRDYVVRGRHITYRLKGDDTDHKLDVLGLGNQYVATGIHPSGDLYEWDKSASLMDAELVADLTKIDKSDIERFLEDLTDALEKSGGEIVRSTGGGGAGVDEDITDLEPVMDIDTVLDGLDKLENSEENFLHREEFVSALAAIRAALGRDSMDRSVEDDIREWATKDPEWCDDDYFDKVWRSLEKVRVPRDSLDRLFRKNGITSHIRKVFDDRAKEIGRDIKKSKQVVLGDRAALLKEVAGRYIFGRVSNRSGAAKAMMRSRWDVDHDWGAIEWWKCELAESDLGLIDRLQEEDIYNSGKNGLANFLRDMQEAHPDSFYSAEIADPRFERGEIVKEQMPDGSHSRGVNMRYQSQTIAAAKKPPADPKQAQADVDHILEFVRRMFGAMARYELDTLAYMAQSGERPGCMLFLVGDSGVGKSVWLNLVSTMFDGTGPGQSGVIDGSKLGNESARRFMLGEAEGCRILTIKELPEGSGPRDMANTTSMLKQIVDGGAEGDYLTIEKKGQQQRQVRNFARVQISSNYANALHVEAQDRRIFYVRAGISLENRPNIEFYDELDMIKAEPKRLAAFWRYLRGRDIGDYSRHKAPPISAEKAERIIAEISSSAERHAAAAVHWIKASDRSAFTSVEFADFMNDCAAAEYQNSGNEGDLVTYDAKNPAFMRAIRSIHKSMAIKLDREIRTTHNRFPTIYVMARDTKLYSEMMGWHKTEVLDFMDEEMERKMPPHPMPLFRKEK